MANQLSAQLLAQLFSQEAQDPFLTLLTLDHPSFSAPIRLVNNSVDIVSRSNTFLAFPFKIKMPLEDGESARDILIVLDNVSLQILAELRQVTTEINVLVEMILASLPNDVQMSMEDLKIATVTYSQSQIQARLILDNFLTSEVTSERYTPQNFPGIF